MCRNNKHIPGVKESKSGTECSAGILALISPDGGAKTLKIFTGFSAAISLLFLRAGEWANLIH